ncbi:MAG: hypothetical protein JNK85_03885 [Verrucomicrobiales bacterium]|nr:hypothetical protein [Verrucomicrobiales bacterium]
MAWLTHRIRAVLNLISRRIRIPHPGPFVVGVLIGLTCLPQALAQGALFRVTLLGREYEVFRAPQRPAPFLPRALSNRRTVEGLFGPESFATAIGTLNNEFVGYAASYDPGSGLTLLRDGAKDDEYSLAEDISDDGVIIGWDRPGPTSVVPGDRRPPRAFIYSKESRLRYLDDLFPQVKSLFNQRPPADASGTRQDRVGTKGLSINRLGEMIIQGALVEGLSGHLGHYRLSPSGALTPFVLEGSGIDLNNLGQLPPANPAPKEGLRFQNQFINDRGMVAGTVTSTNSSHPSDADSIKVGIHVDGILLPESGRALATSFNNLGEVAADNGFVWDSAGHHVDVRQVLWALGKDSVFKGQTAFTNGFSRGLINDAGDIVWSDFFLRRVCPEVTMTAELVEGFEIALGKLIVKVGTRFKAKAIVQNTSSRAFEKVQVGLYPPSPLFRQVGEPVPPVPSTLAPGASVEAVFEWEPLQSGLIEASFALQAQGECGTYEKVLTPVPIEFQNSPLSVTLTVEPRPEGTNAIPLCSEFDVVAWVTNLTAGVLKNVGPMAPPTNGANGLILALTKADPSGTVELPPKGHASFRWKMRATRLGEAAVDGLFTGSRDGLPFRVGPAERLSLKIGRTDWIVNRAGDESDADPSDVCPDVDPNEPGLQTTLRAALDASNGVKGPNVVRFDLPKTSGILIEPRRPLPVVTNEVRVLGTTQAGGWIEVSGRLLVANDVPAWELVGSTELRGLAFNRFNTSATLLLSKGHNLVAGCRFGLRPDGSAGEPNHVAIQIAAGDSVIGGSSPGDGSAFRRGDVAILALGANPNTGPNGVIIEGNRFGGLSTDNTFEGNGPVNAIVLVNAKNCRVGGLTTGARNIFSGSKAAAVLLAGSESSDHTIVGNWFGLTSSGAKVELSELNAYGVALIQGAHHNRIGGTSAGSRNVISGSHDAGVILSLGAHDNVVEGNWIGLTGDGNGEAGNEVGIWLLAGANNHIGGSSAASRNVISGNFHAGVIVGRPDGWKHKVKAEDPGDESCVGSVIEGNWIGLDASGARAQPNGRTFRLEGLGVLIGRFSAETILGGTTVGRRNVIAGNEGPGVMVDAIDGARHALWGNFIGLSPDAAYGIANRGPGLLARGDPLLLVGGYGSGEANTLTDNAGPAIELSGLKNNARPIALAGNLMYRNFEGGSIQLTQRRTSNDSLDADTGPNGLQNWPLLRGAFNRDDATRVVVDLASFKPAAVIQVDLFRAHAGGGDLRLLTTNLVVGSTPKNRFLLNTPLQPVGTELTALATSVEGTSEFAPPVPVFSGIDTDGDGIPDDLERTIPATRQPQRFHSHSIGGESRGPGDLNGDGILDELQAQVATVRVPNTADWITVAASPGRIISDLVGLRPTDLPPPPFALRFEPGAVRFTLSQGSGGAEPLQVWLPTGAELPTIWQNHGAGWSPIANATIVRKGSFAVASITLPPQPSETDWLLASAVESLDPPAPTLTLLPQREELWNDSLNSGGIASGSALNSVTNDRVRTLQPVRVALLPGPGSYRLETTTDLRSWSDVPAWPSLFDDFIERSWPVDEGARFFRWRED